MTQTASERCPQCVSFDEETKARLCELFSRDEISLITMLLSASIRFQSIQGQKLRAAHDIKAMQCQRDVDFAATVAGKLLMGLDDDFRTSLLKRIQKDQGVALRMRHQDCPHKEKPKLEAVQP